MTDQFSMTYLDVNGRVENDESGKRDDEIANGKHPVVIEFKCVAFS